MSHQFLMFLITGGIAAGVNFASRIMYSAVLDFSAAIVLAYLTGMVTAFFLAKYFVFKNSQQSKKRSVVFFILVNLVAIFQTWIVSTWLANQFLPLIGVKIYIPEIAHAIGVTIPVFSSYVGHRYLTFR